jgi:hypothetical protein
VSDSVVAKAPKALAASNDGVIIVSPFHGWAEPKRSADDRLGRRVERA